jgi:two-component system, cell cycle response regulator DivK
MTIGKVVLLVESNEDSRRIYSDILRWAGYRVLESAEGAAGIALARTHLPDLVLLALSMPRLDGWSAVRMLKENPATARIPVMALTAHVSLSGQRERAMALGFEAYLVKPILPRDLLRVVDERLGSRSHRVEVGTPAPATRSWRHAAGCIS